jgi:CDP-2,3-bis-(O-geranylgeranyl)-sn-glycerol synthase
MWVRLLLLVAVANMAPIGARRLLGERWSAALDGGRNFLDGRPVLGPSKTWRGLVCAVIGATATALLLDLPPLLGATVGAFAMIGDAMSSFAKRRLGLASSTRATGLDQIPECLLPMLVLYWGWGVSLTQVAGVTAAFFLLEIPLARLAFRLRLRDRPY